MIYLKIFRSVTVIVIIVSVGIISCDSNKKIDRSIVEEVKKSSEVKKVSEAEIVTYAMKWGEEISLEAQKTLIGTLQKAIEENGVADAVGFCNEQALPITREIAQKYGVQIKRVSSKNRNHENKPNENEIPILEAYAYNSENKVESRSNIQKIGDGDTLLFTKAITIPGGLCLNCHGEPGKDINEATLEKIQANYPGDKAVGFKAGDLRGMWSLLLPKKEVIKNM